MAENYTQGITQIANVTINNRQARLIAVNYGTGIPVFEGIYAGTTLARHHEKNECIVQFRERLRMLLDDTLALAEQEVADITEAKGLATKVFD